MHKDFHVSSSDGVSSYVVTFAYDGKDLRVRCDCKAGALGQMCRHKDGLLRGDPSGLAVADDLSAVMEWIAASPVLLAMTNLREAEEKTRAAQGAEKAAKKALSDLLFGK